MSEINENKTPAKTMMLEVVTPYHHFFEGKVESVTLSALDGELGILPGHAPVVVALTPGIAHIVTGGSKRYALMTEGYAEIGPYMTIVVCNAAEWPEDIDVNRAYSAYERAEKRFHDETQTMGKDRQGCPAQKGCRSVSKFSALRRYVSRICGPVPFFKQNDGFCTVMCMR